MIRKSLLCALVAGAVVAIAVGVAPSESYANTVSFTLTSDHCDGGCGPQAGGFGSIVVTDAAGGGVDLTLTLINGNKLINTGLGGDYSFAFDLTGNPTVTYSAFVGFAAVQNPQSAQNFNFDGVGNFDYGLKCDLCGNGGGGGLPGPFSVHISDITTASFAQNANGQFFGVDIISGTTGLTGAVDASVAVQVPFAPVGAGLPGFIAACGGLVALARRRRKTS
jgi:hypothetical protein